MSSFSSLTNDSSNSTSNSNNTNNNINDSNNGSNNNNNNNTMTFDINMNGGNDEDEYTFEEYIQLVEDVYDLPTIPRIEFDPSILSNSRIATFVGEGSFGKVYSVRMNDGSRIALKVIEITENNLAHVEPTTREIRKIVRLSSTPSPTCPKPPHPNIVSIHAYFCPSPNELLNGFMGFTMDYCERGSLANVLANDDILDWVDILHILKDIASGLEHMHSLNEIHRDICPNNILITIGWTAKLCDFNLTRNDKKSMSRNPGRGTLPYKATEIRNGDPGHIGSDMYSFAMTAGVIISRSTEVKEFAKRPNKFQRMNEWMKQSPFRNGRGYERLHNYLVQCISDDHLDRPTSSRMVQVLQEIIEGGKGCVISEEDPVFEL